jgi:hypothetical protein
VEAIDMAQSGFALFFLTVLLGTSVALILWVQQHWTKIAAAARGEMVGSERPASYTALQRRPIDLPYVAQRMLPQPPNEPAPPRIARAAAWMVRRPCSTGRQLGLGF